MVMDGFMIGLLRGAPNAFLTDWTFDPYLNATYYTWLQMWNDTWTNGLFNGIEAAVSAPLAYRVAVSVVPSLGAGGARRRPLIRSPNPATARRCRTEPGIGPDGGAAAETGTGPPPGRRRAARSGIPSPRGRAGMSD